MPVLYHGTAREAASAMAADPGTIDVARGAGEFGRGFYAQSSVSNAMRWAQGRRQAVGCVLRLQIDDAEYARLDCRILKPKQASRLTARLRARKETATYRMGCDVIVGPLKRNENNSQYKFESLRSQDLLNGPQTRREVLS